MPIVPVAAGLSDVGPLSDVLQAAFWDDPVISWVLPDEPSRSRRAARLFAALLAYHYLPMHTVWTTSDAAGAALWAPPGHGKLPTAELVRGLPHLVRALGRHGVRALRFLEDVERHHPARPHWYLGVLGTNPPRQGGGVASALIQPVLDRCDRERVPAYLEASAEPDLAFYARHGFVAARQVRPDRAGPVLYPMWREPR